MKVQRKLTDDELQKVMTARHDIKQMCNWDDTDRGREYWYGVAKQLDAMALHATADGKPWVDPEPPIPEGYRLAVAGDEGRADCEYWSPGLSCWHLRKRGNATAPLSVGNVYIVPIESPIPDGYRLAVAGDEGRDDHKYWDRSATCWLSAPGVLEHGDDGYIVPIDRVPTDEESKSRPVVMVRDRERQDWKKVKLVAVQGEGNQPFVTMGRGSLVTFWRQCRHLYPGE